MRAPGGWSARGGDAAGLGAEVWCAPLVRGTSQLPRWGRRRVGLWRDCQIRWAEKLCQKSRRVPSRLFAHTNGPHMCTRYTRVAETGGGGGCLPEHFALLGARAPHFQPRAAAFPHHTHSMGKKVRTGATGAAKVPGGASGGVGASGAGAGGGGGKAKKGPTHSMSTDARGKGSTSMRSAATVRRLLMYKQKATAGPDPPPRFHVYAPVL